MKKKLILFAEDEQPLSDAMEQKLQRAGYASLHAANGKICLDIALEHKPDLILLDIGMPIMDGLEMLTELRKDDWGKSVPVILLTAFTDIQKVADAVDQHSLHYFVKSQTSMDEIIKKIDEFLG